jgi:hypothetical protein
MQIQCNSPSLVLGQLGIVCFDMLHIGAALLPSLVIISYDLMIASRLHFAGLDTKFEEAWSTLRDALQAAAQVLRGSRFSQSSLSLSFIDGEVNEINNIDEFHEAFGSKDKVNDGHEQKLSSKLAVVSSPTQHLCEELLTGVKVCLHR